MNNPTTTHQIQLARPAVSISVASSSLPWWAPVSSLLKWRIALLNSLSAAAGAMLAAADAPARIAWPVVGVVLLACGAAALNQVQDRDLDSQMERTKNRPLPSGAIRAGAALVIAAFFIAVGLFALALTGRILTVLLGVGAVISYNAIYTPLKRRTAWAPVIGTIVGAFPPAIGWVGAGGVGGRPELIGLIAFFVIWQMPHFWLLLLRMENDYAAAGLPLFTNRLGAPALKRVILVWGFAVIALGFLLPALGAIRREALLLLLVGCAVWLAWKLRGLLSAPTASPTLAAVNIFALVVPLLIIADRLWHPNF